MLTAIGRVIFVMGRLVKGLSTRIASSAGVQLALGVIVRSTPIVAIYINRLSTRARHQVEHVSDAACSPSSSVASFGSESNSGLARALQNGTELGRRKVKPSVEARIRELRAKGDGILKKGRTLGIGTSRRPKVVLEPT